MTTNKEANSNIIAATSAKDSQSQASCPAECCMCGDYGVSNELFRCKVCQFRSQHRYCSNLYPKAESYQVCNWCLSQRDEKDKSQNSSNSSSSNKINGREGDDSKNVKNKKKNHDSSNNNNNNNNNRVLLMKSQRSINLKLQQPNNKPIEKQRSPERLPPPPTPTPRTRKRIITNGALEEKNLIKRKKSEEMANNNNNNNSNSNNTVTPVRRPFFRNKVRRYKLLDEVSS
ncbi:hypothetical protein KPL70_015817 [Citrus sinensis]|nr:uncharacterized protein LOC102607127 [Citrus sinensis]XP_024040197.1 homeobox protein 2 [Citrus x clementina]KAH9690496.1 hypothetical protein KPL70_015817 [Citrus sinensis]